MRVTVLIQVLENLRILLQVMGRELQKEGFQLTSFWRTVINLSVKALFISIYTYMGGERIF